MNYLATGFTALKNDFYLHMQEADPAFVKDFTRNLLTSSVITFGLGYIVIRSLIVVITNV